MCVCFIKSLSPTQVHRQYGNLAGMGSFQSLNMLALRHQRSGPWFDISSWQTVATKPPIKHYISTSWIEVVSFCESSQNVLNSKMSNDSSMTPPTLAFVLFRNFTFEFDRPFSITHLGLSPPQATIGDILAEDSVRTWDQSESNKSRGVLSGDVFLHNDIVEVKDAE